MLLFVAFIAKLRGRVDSIGDSKFPLQNVARVR